MEGSGHSFDELHGGEFLKDRREINGNLLSLKYGHRSQCRQSCHKMVGVMLFRCLHLYSIMLFIQDAVSASFGFYYTPRHHHRLLTTSGYLPE